MPNTKQESTTETLDRLKRLLNIFRLLSPDEFRVLCQARDLPDSGVHDDRFRLPGTASPLIIRHLATQKLLELNPDRPGFYVLSELGNELMCPWVLKTLE